VRACVDGLLRWPSLIAVALLVPGLARAQDPTPTPSPRGQDELDFGRSSLAIGSGARALGMAGAFLARPDDATAASWNPAGLSYLRLPEISVVGLRSTQDVKTVDIAGALSVDHTLGTTPDFVSVALPVSLGSIPGAVQLSFQRVIPFTGERSIVEAPPKLVHGQGGFDVLALGTGFQVKRWLRGGLTVNRWMNGFNQRRERFGRRASEQTVDFRMSGVSFNAGLIVSPHEALNLGVVAKTRLRADVTLRRFRNDFPEEQPEVGVTNSHTSDDVRLDLPGAIGFGASWRPTSPLTLSGDYTRTFWSRSRIHNYFTLPPAAEFQSAATAPCGDSPGPVAVGCPEIFASLPFPNVRDDIQSDTRELRLGVEYVFILGRIKLPLRGGYIHEQQYTLERGIAPRYEGVTAGAGLVLGPLLLDAAYVHQWGRFTSDEGVNTVRLHRALVSLIYRHGG
jgi:hypothetical protein